MKALETSGFVLKYKYMSLIKKKTHTNKTHTHTHEYLITNTYVNMYVYCIHRLYAIKDNTGPFDYLEQDMH